MPTITIAKSRTTETEGQPPIKEVTDTSLSIPMTSTPQVQGRPSSIVTPTRDPNAPYQLNLPELEAILKNKDVVDKKIVLISISGAYRKGKSFMLNLLIAYLDWLERGQEGEWLSKHTPMDKFHYQGGTQPDTNGIVMWNKPYFLKGKNGQKYAVFLMDTQGAFDHKSSVQECAAIFGMSTLLSSVQIFNLSGQIQADDLNNLRLFTEYALLAKSDAAQFQKLLFLIRDWANPDEFAYGFEGGRNYLQNLLSVNDEQHKENQEVRKNLKKSFEKLEAFLMPHPGKQVAVNNSKTSLGEIDQDFEDELLSFIPNLFKMENLPCKKISGQEITGGELCELFKAYMKVFNSGELPEPKTILEATSEAVIQAAQQAAKDVYDKKMTEEFSVHLVEDLDQLTKLHKVAVADALKRFDARPKIGESQKKREKYSLEGTFLGTYAALSVGNPERRRNEEPLLKYFELRYIEFKKSVEQNIKLKETKEKLEQKPKVVYRYISRSSSSSSSSSSSPSSSSEEETKKKGKKKSRRNATSSSSSSSSSSASDSSSQKSEEEEPRVVIVERERVERVVERLPTPLELLMRIPKPTYIVSDILGLPRL